MDINQILNIALIILTILSTLVGYYFKIKEKILKEINGLINNAEDGESIKYGSAEFAEATVSEFALKQCHIAARALCSTAIDLIENESLLQEIKIEFYNTIN